nr:MAG TPA: hypothetical protein [Bacteriophage sp.]
MRPRTEVCVTSVRGRFPCAFSVSESAREN